MPYTDDKAASSVVVLRTHLSKWVWYPDLGVVDRKLKGERKIDQTIVLNTLKDTEKKILIKVLLKELEIMNSFNAV